MINKLFIFFLLFTSSLFAADLKNGYVGQKVCAQCHVKEAIQWSGSHHELAMQEATPDTVLGDFKDFNFTYNQVTSIFYYKANKYWVRTDGPDGTLQDFIIKYTFGVYPLQQYLIELPGGRLQVLDIAWDSRRNEQGGQRWFHLHADDNSDKKNVDFKHALHWTGANRTWNTMCADCHSTNVKKNYDAASDSYTTQWSELNVSCEACHGPGQSHQQWAESHQRGTESHQRGTESHQRGTLFQDKTLDNKGLTINFNKQKDVRWKINPVTGKPYRSAPRQSNAEIETCARCHSRRSQFAPPRHSEKLGEEFFNNFRPALLTRGLYHADGQIQDEVYVYGSFLQSKMHQAGVTCSDCHEAHTTGLKLSGDRVCNQCHMPSQYRTQKHHFHPASSNTSCLDCHMTAKTYMGVDQRHDHSFRIPRPDLSVQFKTPNACNQCHSGKSNQWAMEQVSKWYGQKEPGLQHYTSILHAQRQNEFNADKQAINLLQDKSQPIIARATALTQFSTISDRETLEVIEKQLQHEDVMIRVAALDALSSSNPYAADNQSASASLDFNHIAQLVFPLLDDKAPLVRMEAGRILAPVDQEQLTPEDQKKLHNALQEYIQSQLFNAERPKSQVNLGNLYYSMSEYPKAEQAYRQALKLQTQFVPAWINLAQFYSDLNRDKDALQTLQLGLKQIPQSAEIYHAIGLAQVRQQLIPEAMDSLAKSTELAPQNSRFSYVYGIALNSYKRPEEALAILEQAYQLQPENMDILSALVSINRNNDYLEDALKYAKKIVQLEPDNPELQRFIIQSRK